MRDKKSLNFVFSLLSVFLVVWVGFYVVLFSLFLTSAHMTKLNFSNNFMSSLAFITSIVAISLSAFFTINNNSNNADKIKKEEECRKKEQELQYIKDSINLFYIPLLDLLETDNLGLKNTVEGHRYLAEPRVSFLFEEYLQTNKNKEKIIKLAHRDLEQLQKKLIKN